jgi:O-antigen/teichoic acid export membrane protein
MIKNMLGDKELGLYSVAKTLTEVWYFIPMIITQSVFPAIVNAKKVSEEMYKKRIMQVVFLLGWLGIFISTIVSLLSYELISILYGKQYIEAYKVLSIYSWSIFVLYWMAGISTMNYIENTTKLAFYAVAISSISNVVLNLILIPLFGINGAAISFIISQLLAGPIMVTVLVRSRIILAIKGIFYLKFLWSGEVK